MNKYLSVAVSAMFLFMSAFSIGAAEERSDDVADRDHKCPGSDCPAIAPDFTLADPNGKQVSLSDYKDKKVVVLEWTNWDCPFVKYHYEKGTFAKLIDKYTGKSETGKENGVVWLTINSTHYAKPQDNRAAAEKYKLDHPILSDQSGKVGKLYKATNTPQIVIVDKTGHAIYRGAIDNAPFGKLPEGEEYINYVDQALREHLAGEEIATPKTKAYGCTVKYPPQENGG